MGEANRVGRDHFPFCIEVTLNAFLERLPLSIKLVLRWMSVVVDGLFVVVVYIRASVGESPRDIAIEPDHNSWHSRKSNSSNIELTWNDDVHLVPHRRQREIEVRISGKQRVTRSSSLW